MTHYDVLGVDPTADPDAVKRAYYRKARAYHPDAHAGSSSAVVAAAERNMAALNAAWNVLRDDVLRSEYDDALAAARQAVTSARSRNRPRRKQPPPPRLSIGSGFRFWMGSCGFVRDEARPRFNLAVEGTTDLSPLRALAPSGLYGLHAANTDISDEALAHLGPHIGLQQLDLAATKVTDAGLLHLQGLERLEVLSLWDTTITDAGVAILGRPTSLRHLGLGNTVVTDAGLAGLAGLRGLRVLQLWGTKIKGHGLEHLHGLLDLERVTVPRRVRTHHRRRLAAAVPAVKVTT